jgi:hypothetical protein
MATIYKDSFGVSAFTADQRLVMNGSAPCVAWSFRIKELEDWLTTLEEIMPLPSMVAHRRALEGLYFSLKAAHAKHKEQHDEIVTNAPTADDLMQYLAAYAASIAPHSHG